MRGRTEERFPRCKTSRIEPLNRRGGSGTGVPPVRFETHGRDARATRPVHGEGNPEQRTSSPRPCPSDGGGRRIGHRRLVSRGARQGVATFIGNYFWQTV